MDNEWDKNCECYDRLSFITNYFPFTLIKAKGVNPTIPRAPFFVLGIFDPPFWSPVPALITYNSTHHHQPHHPPPYTQIHKSRLITK